MNIIKFFARTIAIMSLFASAHVQAQESSGFSVSTVEGSASSNEIAGYNPADISTALGLGYGPNDAALFNEAKEGGSYTTGCLYDYSNPCIELTKPSFVDVKTTTQTCENSFMASDYNYGSCADALALGYTGSPSDVSLWDAAHDIDTYGSACQEAHSAACITLDHATFTVVRNNVDVCNNYDTYTDCVTATAVGYGYDVESVTLWDSATSGDNEAVCQDLNEQACNTLAPAVYTIAKNLAENCSIYDTFDDCKAATELEYGFTSGDVSLWGMAKAGEEDEACAYHHDGSDCDGIDKGDYELIQVAFSNCSAYSAYNICAPATLLGYMNTSDDVELRTAALADTTNNLACITVGGLAADATNACSQLSKELYNTAKVLGTNQAVYNAIGNADASELLTAAQFIASDAYTNFADYNTGCSSTPSTSEVTSNFDRIRHYLRKASFSGTAENVAKQLCYATGEYSALSWHASAPLSYIIAANNSVTNAPDWRNCGFWGKRTALTKASTNAQKSAGNTIIYDIKTQDDNVFFTAPSISSDKGHAVLNYTLADQTAVTSSNVTLSVLGRNSDGFIVASTPDRVVSVSAQNKVQTSDAIYNVFQRTASSSTSTLKNAINSAGNACPSGYSFVSTTNSSELTTLRNIAIKHGTGAGTMPAGHQMEQCANGFLECNAGYSACSNPNGANWRMRLMIYGDKNGQVCAATRKKASGGTFHTDKTDWPSGFSMYPPEGQCKDVSYSSGTPRLRNGCVGWCWVRTLCKKNGTNHTVWP